jgi:hypothetical protein
MGKWNVTGKAHKDKGMTHKEALKAAKETGDELTYNGRRWDRELAAGRDPQREED